MPGILWAVCDEQAVLEAVPAAYERVFAHHVTFQYGVDLTPELEALLGTEFTATATAVAWDEDIQALVVELPTELRELCTNANPHITVSSRDGVPPVRSNDMLVGRHERRELDLKLVLRFEFKAFNR